MKKRRLNADDRPAQQFHALRQLRSLTDTERREVVGLLNENGHGERTCTASEVWQTVGRYTGCTPADGGWSYDSGTSIIPASSSASESG